MANPGAVAIKNQTLAYEKFERGMEARALHEAGQALKSFEKLKKHYQENKVEDIRKSLQDLLNHLSNLKGENTKVYAIAHDIQKDLHEILMKGLGNDGKLQDILMYQAAVIHITGNPDTLSMDIGGLTHEIEGLMTEVRTLFQEETKRASQGPYASTRFNQVKGAMEDHLKGMLVSFVELFKKERLAERETKDYFKARRV
jgi:hypothetical protein